MAERFSRTTNINEVILNSNRLSKMPRDSRLLATLDQGVKSIIDGQLADHCQIGKIEGHFLIYYVDSPIWAHTFRMSKMSILATLQSLSKNFLDLPRQDTTTEHISEPQGANLAFTWSDYEQIAQIEDIQIRVRPSIKRPVKFKKSQAPLPKFSKETARSIEETAASLQDPELAALWASFGRRHSI